MARRVNARVLGLSLLPLWPVLQAIIETLTNSVYGDLKTVYEARLLNAFANASSHEGAYALPPAVDPNTLLSHFGELSIERSPARALEDGMEGLSIRDDSAVTD